MAQYAADRFPYTLDTITQSAPPMSGTYAIFSRAECMYVGDSDDVCADLLAMYYEDRPCLNEREFTHFLFNLAPPELREAHRIDRIREFAPLCNLRTGSDRCGECSLAGPQTAGGSA